MSGVEIERKWLIREAPVDALAVPEELIEQGYLTIGSAGAETRVRRKGGSCFLTVKSGLGMTRAEHEVELSDEQFEALWPATAGARVVKHRRVLPTADGRQIELDVFEGALSGLIVAEVEFDDPCSAESFVAPHWFGPEVTDDPAYKNHRLAMSGEPPAPTSR